MKIRRTADGLWLHKLSDTMFVVELETDTGDRYLHLPAGLIELMFDAWEHPDRVEYEVLQIAKEELENENKD